MSIAGASGAGSAPVSRKASALSQAMAALGARSGVWRSLALKAGRSARGPAGGGQGGAGRGGRGRSVEHAIAALPGRVDGDSGLATRLQQEPMPARLPRRGKLFHDSERYTPVGVVLFAKFSPAVAVQLDADVRSFMLDERRTKDLAMKKIVALSAAFIFMFGLVIYISAYLFEKYKIVQFFVDFKNSNVDSYHICIVPSEGFPIIGGRAIFEGKDTLLYYSDFLMDSNVPYVIFTKKDSNYFFVSRIKSKRAISLVGIICDREDRQRVFSILSEMQTED
jgi:hypothetical protein